MDDFLQGFLSIVNKKEEAAKKGLAVAGFELLSDCLNEVPTVPLKEGTLRGSGSVFVGEKLTATTADLGESEGDPATQNSEPIPENHLAVTVGFNTPYAHRLHEHPEYNFTEEGSGGKFLESKLDAHRDEYLQTVADEMSKANA